MFPAVNGLDELALHRVTRDTGSGVPCDRVYSAALGASASGKPPVFGTGIRRFESCRPSHEVSCP
jgi:hypothetical protein